MKLTKTKLDGVVILEPDVFGDHRGFFMESWSKRKMEEMGLHYDFVQDNHSSSTVKGTLRGIHTKYLILRVLPQHIVYKIAANKTGAAGH